MKKLLPLLPLALLCGCAREPSPVSALALDRAGTAYRLTAELVRQDTPEDAAVPSCLAAQGDSFTDALHALEGLLPGELYLSHAQVLLLSEQGRRGRYERRSRNICAGITTSGSISGVPSCAAARRPTCSKTTRRSTR